MAVVGALVAGLATANALAATTKNVMGALKETGEVINNAYEGGKKVVKDLSNKNAEDNKPKKSNRKEIR